MPFDGSGLDDVTKLLIEGRDRIERGWCRNRLQWNGAVCMLGAIGWGERPSARQLAARNRLARAIGTYHVPRWQDAPERTKTDVLAAYDAAIAG